MIQVVIFAFQGFKFYYYTHLYYCYGPSECLQLFYSQRIMDFLENYIIFCRNVRRSSLLAILPSSVIHITYTVKAKQYDVCPLNYNIIAVLWSKRYISWNTASVMDGIAGFHSCISIWFHLQILHVFHRYMLQGLYSWKYDIQIDFRIVDDKERCSTRWLSAVHERMLQHAILMILAIGVR